MCIRDRFGTVRVQEMADEAAAYLQRMAEAADVRLVVSADADGVVSVSYTHLDVYKRQGQF